jgi:hypothetical protein
MLEELLLSFTSGAPCLGTQAWRVTSDFFGQNHRGQNCHGTEAFKLLCSVWKLL